MVSASVTPTIESLSKDPPVDVPRELPGMLDLVLRGQATLSAVLTEERHLPGAIKRMLALAIAGLFAHGAVAGAAAEYFAHQGVKMGIFTQGHPVLWMPPTFVLAFVGALSICLPSFYFYTQIAGLDASFRLITAQALRGQATTSVLLFGALPFYVAVVLAAVLGFGVGAQHAILAGLVMPFAVGLLGVHAIYRGFNHMLASLPITHQRRGNFIRRLVAAWGAVYTAVAPVALYRIAETLGAAF